MSRIFDAIVVGLGGMGSAACFELARRGRRVLGLEQFDFVHDQGSSHGQTRIIRTAYFEGPGYVPILKRAWERWYELEQLAGAHLLTECACLNIGRPSSEIVTGVGRSAAEHALPIEVLQAADLGQRFPFRFEADYVGILEHRAGFLYVEKCVQAHLLAAQQLGADIHAEEPVANWSVTGGDVEVATGRDTYRAARLVIAAGPWAGRLLRPLGCHLRLMRQPVFWFATADDHIFRRNRFPVFIAETDVGAFYGFPVINGDGLKVAQHYGSPELEDPDQIDRSIQPGDELPVSRFLQSHLPLAAGPVRRASLCTYTVSPDRHFIIDVHPNHTEVCFAAGFSGHGFKFATVIGEILADLADAGRTDHPIEPFMLRRFNP